MTSQPGIAFRDVTRAEVPVVVALMKRLYAHEGFAFDASVAASALDGLLARPDFGAAWLIEERGRGVGYVVLSVGYSLEYGGFDAFVDELFVEDESRGRGVGGRAIEFLVEECRRRGVRALHLEVERGNDRAARLYGRHGFGGADRRLMTRRIAG